jgi:hypothetical protein
MEKRSTIFSPLIWLLCLIAIAIIVFAVAFIVALYRNRPIAFDSDQWKFAPKNANLDIRYRMTDDLMSVLDHREPSTRDDIEELLGPPERGSSESHIIGYLIGRKFIGSIPYHGYYLRMVFDEDDTLVETQVAPE